MKAMVADISCTDEIREHLQAELRYSDQEWLDTFCREHQAVFGEDFVIK